jgi:hypothetical protein
MAVQYTGLNRGQQSTSVVTGTSSNSVDVEVAVDLSKNLTRKEVLDKLDQIRDFIFNTRTTPYAQ